jgi:cell division control protein 45
MLCLLIIFGALSERIFTQLHTLILLNMGSITDLPNAEWFGEFALSVGVHVIDSSRPRNLASMFAVGENAERILVWDDGEADKLEEEKKAWEALTVCHFIIRFGLS